jgi:YHS domain-containing protein
MSAAGLVTEGLFAALGAIPARSHGEVVHSRFEWNYTTFLNIGFLAVFGVLYWLYRNRSRLGGGAGYAVDPVCGMQVQTANAPASAVHQGHAVWFCSDRCRERFEADPARYDRGAHTAHDQTYEPMEESPMATDPACGMTVDPITAAAVRRHGGRNWFFCAEGCARRFDEDPERYATATPSPSTPPAATGYDHP